VPGGRGATRFAGFDSRALRPALRPPPQALRGEETQRSKLVVKGSTASLFLVQMLPSRAPVGHSLRVVAVQEGLHPLEVVSDPVVSPGTFATVSLDDGEIVSAHSPSVAPRPFARHTPPHGSRPPRVSPGLRIGMLLLSLAQDRRDNFSPILGQKCNPERKLFLGSGSGRRGRSSGSDALSGALVIQGAGGPRRRAPRGDPGRRPDRTLPGASLAARGSRPDGAGARSRPQSARVAGRAGALEGRARGEEHRGARFRPRGVRLAGRGAGVSPQSSRERPLLGAHHPLAGRCHPFGGATIPKVGASRPKEGGYPPFGGR
jgi:hypothetical protein